MTAAAGRPASAWRSGPLAVRSFRLLTAGQFASTIGDFCYAVALPWLVLSAHGGAILLGTVLACYGVPRTVLIPVGGVLADKVGPRTLMLAADAARCVLVAGPWRCWRPGTPPRWPRSARSPRSSGPARRRGQSRGGALPGRRLQRPGQRHRPDRLAEVGAPGPARAGYEHADAVRVRQLPAVGGRFRSAGASPRSLVVLPGGGRPGRGGDPGRADAAGVPGLRGGREHEGPGHVSRSGGNTDRGLKPGPVRHKKRARAEYGGKAGYDGKGAAAGVPAPVRR